MDTQHYEEIQEVNTQILQYMDYFSNLSIHLMFLSIGTSLLFILHGLFVGKTLDKIAGEKRFRHRLPLIKGIAASSLLDGKEKKVKVHKSLRFFLILATLFAPPLVVLLLLHNFYTNSKLITLYSDPHSRWISNLFNILTLGLLGLVYVRIDPAHQPPIPNDTQTPSQLRKES